MGETEILTQLHKDLRLDLWWQDLIGQEPKKQHFDFEKARDSIPRSDNTAAQIIADKLRGSVSYNEFRDQWYVWDGILHQPCDGIGIAIKVVKLFHKAVTKALDFVEECTKTKVAMIEKDGSLPEPAKVAESFQKRTEGAFKSAKGFRDKISSNAGTNAVASSLKTELDVPRDYYDNDQRWFVCKNGVFDLEALKVHDWNNWFLPHNPERNVTKMFDAEYRPGENLGHFDRFMERSIPDADSRKFLQKSVGACFMGTAETRVIINLFGPPSSGKSVFTGTMKLLGQAGAGYSAMPDAGAVTKQSGQNFAQDEFKGRRFIGVSEPDHREPIDDDFLKRFSGDVSVTTRTLNKKGEDWIPQGMLFIASNDPLKVNTRDTAIVQRIHTIEFPIHFESGPGIPPERQAIDNIKGLLLEDRSRILEWIIQGMLLFIEDGMSLRNPPQKVLEHQDKMVVVASTALRWLGETIEEDLLVINPYADDKHAISVNDAYSRYDLWTRLNGERYPMKKMFFKEDIENRYHITARNYNGVKVFPGIIKTAKYLRKFDARLTSDTPGQSHEPPGFSY